MNDNSYYSYNNDSRISFKKKNFKTKHFNNHEENNFESVSKLEDNVNNNVVDKAKPNIEINKELNDEAHLIKNIHPQAAEHNNDNVDNFEKKREEQVVLEYLRYVNEKYPNLVKVNELNKNISKITHTQAEPRFFVIKSFTEEDIHKVL